MKYEMSFHPGEMVKFEVDLPEKDERVVFICKKIYIAPEKSFFQKYGSYFIIGLSLIVQVFIFVIFMIISLL